MASLSLVALGAAGLAAAQTLTFPATPLNQLSFPKTTDLPYQIYPDSTPYVRGPQTGYNICNSTTENQDSLCQTQWLNGLDDFCLWAPAKGPSNISDTEGDEVAWCTKKGWGTRIMEEGTLQGAQLLKTNEYWMITGLIDQSRLNIDPTDFGGELDSGGQDERGNPIGGQMYSTAFNSDYQQIQWWTEFIGSNQFCIKICNPSGSNNPGYCQHTLDRIGLLYNCPSKYTAGGGFQAGEFEICDSDLMTVPGIYVDASGHTQSYVQPPESLGEITSIPYTPTVVASSNCQTTASSALFTDLVSATNVASTTGSASGSAATGSSASGSTAGSSGSAAASSGSATGSAAAASGSAAGANSSGATSRSEGLLSLFFSLAAGMFGVGAAISLLA